MLFPTLTNLLNAGADLNRNDPLRNGNMLCFPGLGDLVVAGDLHNHGRNFARVQSFANLEENPDRHVILQEIVHGGPIDGNGSDRSLDMLLDAITWAEKFPGRVHFLLANHDLAQLQGLAIMKDGYDLTERFSRYFHVRAGSNREAATHALSSFIVTMPLAAITLTGIFLSHSLPGPRELPTFDNSILRRQLTEEDFARNGSVYNLIWGRGQTVETLNVLSKAWWSDLFVCGHQSQDQGYGIIGERMLVIDSSHNHGVVLRFSLDKQYTMQDLVNCLRPLASIA